MTESDIEAHRMPLVEREYRDDIFRACASPMSHMHVENINATSSKQRIEICLDVAMRLADGACDRAIATSSFERTHDVGRRRRGAEIRAGYLHVAHAACDRNETGRTMGGRFRFR